MQRDGVKSRVVTFIWSWSVRLSLPSFLHSQHHGCFLFTVCKGFTTNPLMAEMICIRMERTLSKRLSSDGLLARDVCGTA